MHMVLPGVGVQEIRKWDAGWRAESPAQTFPSPGLTYEAWEIGGCTWTTQHLGWIAPPIQAWRANRVPSPDSRHLIKTAHDS